MSSVGAAYITKQPRDVEIHNTFALMGNEHFIRSWATTEGTCDCSGSYYTTLTDTRLLLRSMDTTCCSCCCEPGHMDVSIFLRDIAEIRESSDNEDCCSCCCTKCCACCGCCKRYCGGKKYLEIRGVFGSEILHVSKADILKLQSEIPAAVGNHKLVSHY
ncbi:unnamed protein product [Rotaria sp. Silwood2]|nr:unnamed protein product [Rotaria sp. Silwood2]CAF2959627.1 unnamed protein product [Rotaria sp. Silwood2]CAF3906198.1 unnamed protein product [Rotaria sp. Silwood2]